jgi:Ion channel
MRFHNIRGAISKYISHFSEQQKQFFTADEIYEREMLDVRKMKAEFVANLEKLPPIVSFIGMPFYYLGFWFTQVKYRVRSVSKFNIYQDWNKLDKAGRFRASTIVTLNFLGFLLWGLIMRLVNSFTLSLNAFVTLGYGEIEAKGIARYFCVIEGLVGWFLLSIFSVSLISQILQ